ncbi:hypothetical protein PHMEG_00016882 [Phytophthora megakarya]|uniref:HTH CENPB-type domain-containing protein n=1 Tax=Phytophthora megakarya TaxID=4795 RepID=A0A225W0A0_9STRA|nr:hypothetical protein PHMEG_00016882 [Phytophthora megakarya]
MAQPIRRGHTRRNLTYREKLTIIRKKEEEPAWTQHDLAMWAKQTFRLESKPTQATISNLLRNKNKVLNTAVPPEYRTARRVKHPELDQKMLLWVHQELLSGCCLTRGAIQNAAVELAQEMQLPTNVTFSKGWVSSFMTRHQISCPPKNGGIQEQETNRQEMLIVTTEAMRKAEQIQIQEQVQESEEEMEDHSMEVEEQIEEVEVAEPSIITEEASPLQTKRRRLDEESNDLWLSKEGETRMTAELLLDWIAVPGSYSRWWLMKNDDEKEPLCEEVNMFLRSHGLIGVNNVDIRQQITTFVMTFQAAHKWLRQAKVEYPSNVEGMTLEQEGIQRQVLQMCPHYERLVSVLAAYVNYDDTASTEQRTEISTTATVQSTSQDITPDIQARERAITVASLPKPTRQHDSSVIDESPPKLTTESRRQSIESSTDTSFEDEMKAQKRRLFELECARLQSEIEKRNVQLMLEKTLARKKLLDAGISVAEVDRIFPL